MDTWKNCDAVERDPDRMSGAWVFRGTRVPLAALFESLRDGASIEEFLAWFPGVDTRAKFALYTVRVPGKTDRFRVAFNIRNPAELLAATQGGAIKIPVALIREFSPDALALMEFGSQLDIDIASKILDTDNPSVHRDLVSLGLKVAPKLSARLVEKVLKWIESPYSGWLHHEYFGRMLTG